MLSYIVVFLLLTCGIYSFIRYSFRHQHLLKLKQQFDFESPPVVPRPLFGVFNFFKVVNAFNEHKFLGYTQDLFDNHGHTFAETTLWKPAIWTDDPTNIKECLSVQFKNFDLGFNRHDMTMPLLGNGIFTSDGKDWSHYRSILRPSFKRAHVGDLDMFEEHIQNLIARIPKNGTTVDLQELFFEYTMDITTDFLFGRSAGSLLPDADPIKKEFSSAFSTALSRMAFRGGLGRLMHVVPDPTFQQSCRTVHKFVEKLVQQSLAYEPSRGGSKSGRYIYLHEISNSTSDPIKLRDHAMHILIAGRDTTAALLSFIFLLLAQNQDVWRLLCREVKQLEGRIPTPDRLKEMKYLHCIIYEVMRLYPAVPFNMRSATVDTTLPVGGGSSGSKPVLVRKGDVVCFSAWTMHRRKDLWGDDADEFRPARWQGFQPGPEYLPFNAGPRVCIGQTFAMSETAYTVVRLVQTFGSIESRDDRPWVEKVGLNLSSLNGVLVGLTNKAGRME